MATLREEALQAFRAGRDEEALALLSEVVRRTPSDHRARMFGAQCLARLGETERALSVLSTTAENLARRDYLLSATLAAKLGLALRSDDARLLGVLRRIHARAAASTKRAAVPPPLPPEPPGRVSADELCAHLRGQDLLEKAYEILGGADDGALAVAGVRPPLPLFAFVDPEAFLELVRRMGLREVTHGEAIVTEGEKGESIFVIVAGRARVERLVRGERKLLATLPGGSLFGELALLTGGVRHATVIAEGEAELFEISGGDLEAVARRFPEVPHAIAQFAEKRVASNMLVTAGLFDNLPPEKRSAVLEKFRPRTVPPGERMVVEEEPAPGLFLVMAGEMSVTKRDPGGETVSLNLLKDGDVFGEISLLSGGVASATVTAVRRSVVAILPREEFPALVAGNPAVGDYLRQLSEGRLQATADSMRPAEVIDAEELVVTGE
ncbi:MAG TPA: cyclic nucleotide-binding domain-containing protein [Myxococcales bacterium]|jgi:CRP-like cAMP-binding protein